MIEEVLLFGWWGSCWCIEVQPFAVLPSTFFFFFFGQVENIVPPSHIIYIRKLFKLQDIFEVQEKEFKSIKDNYESYVKEKKQENYLKIN